MARPLLPSNYFWGIHEEGISLTTLTNQDIDAHAADPDSFFKDHFPIQLNLPFLEYIGFKQENDKGGSVFNNFESTSNDSCEFCLKAPDGRDVMLSFEFSAKETIFKCWYPGRGLYEPYLQLALPEGKFFLHDLQNLFLVFNGWPFPVSLPLNYEFEQWQQLLRPAKVLVK